MAQSLDEFLARVTEGEPESSGSFSVSSDKMLEKMGMAVGDSTSWVKKALQGAIASGATILTVVINRQSLILRAFGPDHFSFCEPELFFSLDPMPRPHYHLFLSLLWLGRDPMTSRLRLCWSTAEGVDMVEGRHGNFQFSRTAVEQEHAFRFFELTVTRYPSTLVERLFRKSNFAAEFRTLNQDTYFLPVPFSVDGRQPHTQTFCPRALIRGVYRGRGDSELTRMLCPPPLERLISRHNQATRRSQTGERFRPEITAYAEMSDRPGQVSTIFWLIDGVVIEQEEEEGLVAGPYHLLTFLCADQLPTDISSLRLTESQKRTLSRRDRDLQRWRVELIQIVRSDGGKSDFIQLRELEGKDFNVELATTGQLQSQIRDMYTV